MFIDESARSVASVARLWLFTIHDTIAQRRGGELGMCGKHISKAAEEEIK